MPAAPKPVLVRVGGHYPIDPGGPVPPLWLAEVVGTEGGLARANVWVDTAETFFCDNFLDPGVPWPVPGRDGRPPGWRLTLSGVGRVGWEWCAYLELTREELP